MRSRPRSAAPFAALRGLRLGLAFGLAFGLATAAAPRAAHAIVPRAPVMEDSPTLPVGTSPTQGPATARITAVLFGDPRDPFTAATRPVLRALRERYGEQLRVVFKFHPNVNRSPDGRLAAEALLAAHAQGRFWELLDAVLDAPSPLTAERLAQLAGAARLDVPRLRRELDAHAHSAALDADVALARAQRVGDYAPVFVVNGTQLVGAHPLERMVPLLEAVRTAAAAITPASAVYRTMVERPARDPEGFPEPPAGFSRVRDVSALYRVPVAGAPFVGPADAPVTIVAFEDFECPVCGRSEPVIQQLLQRYPRDVRFVFRHLPLWIHLDAYPAAEASMEAFAQGGNEAFWRYHHALFAHRSEPDFVSRAALERYAQEQGLEMSAFRRALDARTRLAAVHADVRLATQLGVGGTPAFFVNGRVLTGFQPLEALVAAVERGRAEAQAALARGVAPAGVYEALTAGGSEREVFLPAGPGGTEPRYPVSSRATAPARGPDNAPVRVVLFASMEGLASARVTAALEALAARYPRQLRLEFRSFFVGSVHPRAALAAEAAYEAFAQRGLAGFARYRDALYANQGALERADLERYAQQQRLDLARFRAALDARTHRGDVGADNDAARAFGFAFEAPVTYVNGLRIAPNAPASQLEAAVVAAVNAAGGAAPAAPARAPVPRRR